MSERLENWIDATRACVTAALAAPADTERLLEAFCAIEALASLAPLLSDTALSLDPMAWLGLSAGERRALIARGKLAIGPLSSAALPSDDEDERVLALRLVRTAAQRGLARLTHASEVPEHGARSDGPGDRVPERTLLRLVRGELDGFRAQEISRRIAASAEAGIELRLLLDLPVETDALLLPTLVATLRLAADGPAEVRDPSTGIGVGSLVMETSEGPLELEAVRFEADHASRVLAIYASRAVPLVLAGSCEGWTVRGSAPGYLELEDMGGQTPIVLLVEDREAQLTVRPS